MSLGSGCFPAVLLEKYSNNNNKGNAMNAEKNAELVPQGTEELEVPAFLRREQEAQVEVKATQDEEILGGTVEVK